MEKYKIKYDKKLGILISIPISVDGYIIYTRITKDVIKEAIEDNKYFS